MSNGVTKAITQIIELAKIRPIVAIILAIILFSSAQGGISYFLGSWGTGSEINSAVAALRNDLENQDRYLKSAIKQESIDRIREITQLKEDGKLLSEDSIRLIIFQELRKSEDRIIKRLMK